MDEECARKIIKILLSAHGTCADCAYWLAIQFALKFRGFSGIAKEMYIEKFGKLDFFDEEDF